MTESKTDDVETPSETVRETGSFGEPSETANDHPVAQLDDGSDSLKGEGSDGSPLPMKKADIKTAEDLLRYVYQEAGKQCDVPATMFEQVFSSSTRTDDLLPLVRKLAASDPLMDVPPRLMIRAEESGVSGSVRRVIAVLMGAALLVNPAFREPSILELVEGSVVDGTKALAALHRRTQTSQSLGQSAPPLKEPALKKLRANAITTLTLLISIRQRWSLDEIVDALNTYLWQTKREENKSPSPEVLLLKSKEPASLGVLAGVFAERLGKAESRLQEADEFALWSKQQANQSAEELERSQTELNAQARKVEHLQRDVEKLNQQVLSEQEHRIADRAHHAADQKALRTRILRMLIKERELLEDGLHAVQKGRPHVAEEFMERVLDSLRAEADNLNGGS